MNNSTNTHRSAKLIADLSEAGRSAKLLADLLELVTRSVMDIKALVLVVLSYAIMVLVDRRGLMSGPYCPGAYKISHRSSGE